MGGSLGGDPGANYLEHCGGFSWALYEGLFGLDLGPHPRLCNLMTKQSNRKHKNNLPSQNWCADTENVCVRPSGVARKTVLTHFWRAGSMSSWRAQACRCMSSRRTTPVPFNITRDEMDSLLILQGMRGIRHSAARLPPRVGRQEEELPFLRAFPLVHERARDLRWRHNGMHWGLGRASHSSPALGPLLCADTSRPPKCN